MEYCTNNAEIMFSFIIPVYNVELYIDDCLNSIVNQTFNNYEIILVNDGSTDGSKEICISWADKYREIKLINQANSGLSAARNAGVGQAVGKYLIFLDSDDWWFRRDGLESLDKILSKEKSQIVIWGYEKIYKNKKKAENHKETFSWKSFHPSKERLPDGKYRACAWDKAIEREYYINHKFSFVKGMLAEDVVWSAKLLASAVKITFFDCEIVAYRQRKGSITKSNSEKKASDMYSHILALQQQFSEEKNKWIKKNLASYLAGQYVVLLIVAGKTDILRKNKTEIERLSFFLNYGISHKIQFIKKISSRTGIYAMSNVLKTIYELKNRVFI